MLCIGARIKIHTFIFYIKRYKIPNKLEKLNVVYLCVFHSSVQTHKLSTLAPFEVGRFFPLKNAWSRREDGLLIGYLNGDHC